MFWACVVHEETRKKDDDLHTCGGAFDRTSSIPFGKIIHLDRILLLDKHFLLQKANTRLVIDWKRDQEIHSLLLLNIQCVGDGGLLFASQILTDLSAPEGAERGSLLFSSP